METVILIRRTSSPSHRWHVLAAGAACRHALALAEGAEEYERAFCPVNVGESVARRKLILAARSGRWGVCRTLCATCEGRMLARIRREHDEKEAAA